MSFFGSRRQVESPAVVQRPEPPIAATPPALQAPVGFETVLGANSIMEGTLRSSANVRLDGNFSGTLEISGNVLVGETARINADINARNISIAGAVRGNVTGKKVQLLRTGRIWGDIRAQALTTEEGAFIDGKITMTGQEQPVETSASPVVIETTDETITDQVSPTGDQPTTDASPATPSDPEEQPRD